MLPFHVEIIPGSPPYEQVIFAVQKAMVSGRLKAGAPFPSVRQLSQELRINPNTAHKVVTHLTAAGMLQVAPGIGTIVQSLPAGSAREKSTLLNKDLERLVVDARRLSLSLADVTRALERHWEKLS
jgi:GntR family transcriptional regulator